MEVEVGSFNCKQGRIEMPDCRFYLRPYINEERLNFFFVLRAN